MTTTRIRVGITVLLVGALLVAACAGSPPATSMNPTPGSSAAARTPRPKAVPTPTSQPLPTAPASATKPEQTVCPVTPRAHTTRSLLGDSTSGRLPTRDTFPTGAPREYHVPVLMYHRVKPAAERGHDLADLVVDPKVFESQLEALQAHGWRTITARQLAWAVGANDRLPAKTFVITVDDGREDGYAYAFPILRRHGFVATFFVITSRVDETRYLTWTELCEMQAAGMEIGNHTAGHRDETTFTRSQTDREVMEAQDAIARHLGAPAVSFAYPFGQRPANLVASVMAAGLEVAFTTVGGAQETAATAYLWPRVRVHPTTTARGILWLANLYG